MKKKKPDPPPPTPPPEPAAPELHLTAIEFTPSENKDAIGDPARFLPLMDMQFPVAIPLVIILLTLIYSTGRDISGFNRRIHDMKEAEAPSLELLKKVPKQSEFVESLHKGLQKLAPTDPVAAKFLHDFYPPPPPRPTANDPSPSATGTETPAQ